VIQVVIYNLFKIKIEVSDQIKLNKSENSIFSKMHIGTNEHWFKKISDETELLQIKNSIIEIYKSIEMCPILVGYNLSKQEMFFTCLPKNDENFLTNKFTKIPYEQVASSQLIKLFEKTYLKNSFGGLIDKKIADFKFKINKLEFFNEHESNKLVQNKQTIAFQKNDSLRPSLFKALTVSHFADLANADFKSNESTHHLSTNNKENTKNETNLTLNKPKFIIETPVDDTVYKSRKIIEVKTTKLNKILMHPLLTITKFKSLNEINNSELNTKINNNYRSLMIESSMNQKLEIIETDKVKNDNDTNLRFKSLLTIEKIENTSKCIGLSRARSRSMPTSLIMILNQNDHNNNNFKLKNIN
jgi:hypothetical protein